MLMIYMSTIDTQEEKSKFEELYYQYRKLMHWRAKQILNDDMLAEDAVHEAFIKIIRHLNKISEIKCNKTKHFVVIVVESTAMDIVRKIKKNDVISWDEIEADQHFVQPEEMGNLTTVEEAIGKLPSKYQQIFVMKYSWGYENSEISDILGVREVTIRQRIARGKKLLSDILKDMEVYIDGQETNNR